MKDLQTLFYINIQKVWVVTLAKVKAMVEVTVTDAEVQTTPREVTEGVTVTDGRAANSGSPHNFSVTPCAG